MTKFSLCGLLVISLSASVAGMTADRPDPDPEAAKAYETLRTALLSAEVVHVEVTGKVEVLREDVVSAPAPIQSGVFTKFKEGGGRIHLGDLICSIGQASPRGGQRLRSFAVIHAGNDDAYQLREATTGPYWMLLDVLRDLSYPMLGILFGQEKHEDSWMQLHWKTPWLAPTSLREEVIEDRAASVIGFTSPEGSLDLFVDPERNRLVRAVHLMTGGAFVEAGSSVRTTYTYTYPDLDDVQIAAFRTFVPGDRQRVETVAALVPRRPVDRPVGRAAGQGPGLGEPAPALRLELVSEEIFDLAAMRGSVVVVDFWATWCAPCLAALPQLERLQRWAHTENLAVHVVTVNTFELPGGGADARRNSVRAWLRERPLSLPVALDLDDQAAAAWGVTGIPATFVIDPGGRIVAQHAGMSPDYLGRLQSEVERALELAPE